LSHAPHSEDPEDLAPEMPSKELIETKGLPRSRSNQFLSLASPTRGDHATYTNHDPHFAAALAGR